MEFLKRLKPFFETLVKPKAEAICLTEFPDGADCMEAVILGNYYKDAFEKGLFNEMDEERVKAILRNQRLKHGGEIFSEERIEATIACMREACEDVGYIIKHTDQAQTKIRLAETPDIWQR